MLTKYILHIGDTDYELTADDLKNWDEIRCSYKRASYDGIVRSFTSQFVFVNKAKELLQSLFLADRFDAKASVTVLTIDDTWRYHKQFECPLDFSTVSWDANTLSINSIDNSLAAIIKACKSTKYEFLVDDDIKRDGVFNFDRLPMRETLTYGFTQGEQYDDSADILVHFKNGMLPWVGNIGNEIAINGIVDWLDDQEEDSSGYIFRVTKDVTVGMEYDLEWRTDVGTGGAVVLSVRIRRNGAFLDTTIGAGDGNGGYIVSAGKESYHLSGSFDNPGQLPDPETLEITAGAYAVVDNIVWTVQNSGRGFSWRNTGKSVNEFFTSAKSGRITLNLKTGDEVVIAHTVQGAVGQPEVTVRFLRSKFVFDWISRGDKVNIDVFRPENLAARLLQRMADNHVNVSVEISGYDSRIKDTYLLGAESIRGISDARLYSSFAEFCDWMSAVFGYVYYIGDSHASEFIQIRECGQYEGSPWAYENAMYSGNIDAGDIVYIPMHARFLYHDTVTDRLYSEWSGCEEYNGADGHPRTDTLFRINELDEHKLYYFDRYSGVSLYPVEYGFDEKDIHNDSQTVHFVHRSELFNVDAGEQKIENCRDLKYTVDAGAIYSTVVVGYDKKDYESINGRDEFNFNNTYTTGCVLSDKTLSLLSKYRADCYGIEFAAQKRGEDTTDAGADKDLFFVLCATAEGNLVADRTLNIENTLTEYVFNGAFSPMACVRANAGYIGLQANSLTLQFASSAGNSEIVINGESMSDSILINQPIATCATVEFSSDAIGELPEVNSLITVVDNGIRYRGYLKEIDVKYARTETVKYKLIVKDIES